MDSYEIREEAVRIIGEDRVPTDVLEDIIANYGEPPALDSVIEALGERMNNDNFKRGDRAAVALAVVGYDDPAVTIAESIPTPSGARSPGTAYPISDLIADLCHLARRVGVSDLVGLVEHGVAQYGGDCVEQAWENDEDFDNLLQTEDSVARALTILRIAGVPERFDAKVLRMIGLGEFDYPATSTDGNATAINMLCVRDPDSENEYVLDGEVNVITLDLGGDWNGYKDFCSQINDPDSMATEYERDMLDTVKDLAPDNPVRVRLQEFFAEAHKKGNS